MTSLERRNSVLAFAFLSVLGGAFATEPLGQDRAGRAFGAGPVAPSVWAMWFARTAGATPTDLDLVVLWRGALGWYRESTSGEGRMGGPARVVVEIRENIGGVELHVSFDPISRIVRLLGRDIELGDNNAVFVDSVTEGLTHTRIVSISKVGPLLQSDVNLEGRGVELEGLLRRSPESRAFLR